MSKRILGVLLVGGLLSCRPPIARIAPSDVIGTYTTQPGTALELSMDATLRPDGSFELVCLTKNEHTVGRWRVIESTILSLATDEGARKGDCASFLPILTSVSGWLGRLRFGTLRNGTSRSCFRKARMTPHRELGARKCEVADTAPRRRLRRIRFPAPGTPASAWTETVR